MSVKHLERKVQRLLKVIICGPLILIPPAELGRWVRENARAVMRGAV